MLQGPGFPLRRPPVEPLEESSPESNADVRQVESTEGPGA